MQQATAGRILSAVILSAVILLSLVQPGGAHWADLAVAEIAVGETSARMILVFPTGLVAFADGDGDGRLSPVEVRAHRDALTAALAARIILKEGNQAGTLSIDTTASAPSGLAAAPGGHSTLMFTFAWPRPIRRLTIHYGLFAPGVATATCLATILRDGRIQTFVFTPAAREVSFDYESLSARLRRMLWVAGGDVVSPRGHIGLAALLALAAAVGFSLRVSRRRSVRSAPAGPPDGYGGGSGTLSRSLGTGRRVR